jgi:hypothetical protein
MVLLITLGVTFIVFGVMNIIPGDPGRLMLGMTATAEDVAGLNHELGVDRPFLVRYFRYMAGALRGDFGMSYHSRRPVADEIAAVVEEIPKNSGENEILRGIDETLAIKAECLRENRQAFTQACEELLASYKSACDARARTMAEATEEPTRAVSDRWIHDRCKPGLGPEAGDLAVMLHELIESEFSQYCGAVFTRLRDMYAEKMHKLILDFYKNYLLYEMNTFEEIMNYSVSRLRQSEEAPCVSCARAMDEAAFALETILKKNGVGLIRPQPKDHFNSKEHEVLVAEKSDGYAKGEIISVMNSGYKLNGLVVMRANVIAAK